MSRSHLSTIILLSLTVPLGAVAAGRSTKPTEKGAKAIAPFHKSTSAQLAQLPIFFEPNRGQSDPSVSYLAKIGNTRFFLTRDSAVFLINKGPAATTSLQTLQHNAPSSSTVVRMRTVNGQRGADEGVERLPGVSNYFIGKDSSKWVSDVPQFARLKRSNVYPGIDMVYYGNQRQLEYDFVVGPGADPNKIELAFEGVNGIRTTSGGDLVLATTAGDFIQKKPKVYQKLGGRQVEVAAHYRIGTGKSVHFEVAGYDRSKALVIDPTIVFNALVGGSGDDFVTGVAVDSTQNVYVTGNSTGADFPLVSPYQSTYQGTRKIFIFKLNYNGTALLYSTYLGGEGNDYATGIGVDSSGNAVIAGATSSLQYPTLAAAQPTFAGGAFDGIVTKISASGGALLFSTFAGGSSDEQFTALALSSNGDVLVAGTGKIGYPTTPGVFQPNHRGSEFDGIVARYTSAGAVVYASYLGGENLDDCHAIAVDGAGNAYVTGRTQSVNFYTTFDAFQSFNASQGGQATASSADVFVTKINPSGSQILYSTYFGGSNEDQGTGIAVDSAGSIYIAGGTNSNNLPLAGNTFQVPIPNPNSSAFVAKFNAAGYLVYRTYLGGNTADQALAMTVDSNSNVYVVGATKSTNFPVLNALISAKPDPSSSYSPFLAVLNASATGLISSTYLGGPGASGQGQYPAAVVLDSQSNIYVAGSTDSPYFKNTAGAINAGFLGDDAFVLKITPANLACVVSVPSSTLFSYASGTSSTIEVFAPSNCQWTVSSNQSWVTLSGNTSGVTGTSPLTISVAPNSGGARTATVGFTTGQSITISQVASTCAYSFNPSSVNAAPAGGSAAASLTASSGCAWNAVSNNSWLTITGGATGTGTGAASAVNYTVTANNSPGPRTGTISLGSQTFTVNQTATNAPSYTGFADTVNCTVISGWAADLNRLNTSIPITLWDGATLLATVNANGFRGDIGAALGDNGLHAFAFPIPTGYSNGVRRTLQVKFPNSAQVGNSPVSFTCGSTTTANYIGYADAVSCAAITGWAADVNRLNTPITVTLWDGTTQLAQVSANILRPDVGAFLGDNGLHKFSFPIPTGYADGRPHSLQVKFENSNTQLGSSPFSITCSGGGPTAYVGYADSVSCSGITGWAADRNRLNTAIPITLWDGATLLATTTANGFRGDIGSFLGDNGLHAFAFPIPTGYADGVTHNLQVRFESSSTQLGSSPVSIRCGGAAPPVYLGYADAVSCSGISGWAADRNRLNTSINMTLWDGATLLNTVSANGPRGDIAGFLGDNGLHAFSFPIPSGYADGLSHSLQVRFENSATQAGNSPVTIRCGGSLPPAYIGYADAVSCSAISGWAADRNRLNTPLTITLWDGNTLLSTVTANGSRPDVGGFLGDNGLHAFSFPVPSAYQDGLAHNLQVRFESSSTQVGNSPVSLRCSANPANYAGWMDTATCSTLSGWAADRNRLNSSIDIQLLDGATVLATLTANGFRSDIGSFLGDNGLHAFSFATPLSIKDGATHNISLKPSGSSTVLTGPIPLKCP